jgi:hypothetical protein
MSILTSNPYLVKNREAYTIILFTKITQCKALKRFLSTKIIGWESQNFKILTLVILTKSFKFLSVFEQ